MSDFQTLLADFRLTTAEIFYHLPDYPDLLQSFIWQDYDLPPDFPKLKDFLIFWEHSLEGKIHSVRIAHAAPMITPKFQSVGFSELIH